MLDTKPDFSILDSKLNIQTKTIGLCVNNTLKIDKDGFDI